MKTIHLALAVTLFLVSQFSFAHGEDKPGPHNGFIQMPGAFHTEVLPSGPNTLKVYLLDIEWKNPTTADSSLVVTHKAKKSVTAKCVIEEDPYVCSFPKNIKLNKKAKLLVEAKRENQKGNTATYDLPLKHQVIDTGHGAHH